MMRSAIHVFDVGHLWYARSRAVLVRMNTEVIPSSSLMRSMVAYLPTFATIRIALSISDCMGLHLASLMPNVSPPEHISPSQEAVGSVDSLPDLILVVLDSPRDIPLAIQYIAQVCVLVGGVDFLTLQGHICCQLPAYSHNPALGGIHSHFPSVRPFGYGIQRGL
ncbi:hypothetical protein AYI69_g10556 [Smittium culicis]|uniref:Uncharacterized protein n=1 Tax=Smittium culicis TaxID=133412 RepID=A0A1R1X4X1_9FUNG|nr:hypothetical protein AYI69_g10556 [Smittium culicis]